MRAGFLCPVTQNLVLLAHRARAAEGIPAGKHSGLGGDVPWSGTVTALLSVSLVVAQRLRKLDFPVKDSEEPSTPGVDKNLFLRPQVPGEDTGKVSAPETWGQSPVLPGLRVASRNCCCYRESQQSGKKSNSHHTVLERDLALRARSCPDLWFEVFCISLGLRQDWRASKLSSRAGNLLAWFYLFHA